MRRRNKLAFVLLLALAVALTGFSAVSADDGAKQAISAETQYARAGSTLLYVRAYYQSGSLKATGSGFLVSGDGLALTAAHVVDKAARVTVLGADGKELECAVVSSDPASDVAVLRLPGGKYDFLALAGEAPEGGAVLRAMGYPIKDTLVITEGLCASPEGTVSGKERMLVTCDIVNGMSGGPIINVYGEVVGLCSGSVRTMDGVHLSAMWNELSAAVTGAQTGE
jgi:S1-C subfamily serine protease